MYYQNTENNIIIIIQRELFLGNYFVLRLVLRVPFVFVYNLYPAKRAKGVMYFAAPNKKLPITDGTNPPFIFLVLRLRLVGRFLLIYSRIILSFQSK